MSWHRRRPTTEEAMLARTPGSLTMLKCRFSTTTRLNVMVLVTLADIGTVRVSYISAGSLENTYARIHSSVCQGNADGAMFQFWPFSSIRQGFQGLRKLDGLRLEPNLISSQRISEPCKADCPTARKEDHSTDRQSESALGWIDESIVLPDIRHAATAHMMRCFINRVGSC